jgi:hypothetical protein
MELFTEEELCLLYRLLRVVPQRRQASGHLLDGLITYGELSDEFSPQPDGRWVDPHPGWSQPLADIDRRCLGLFRPNHRPVLSAVVVTGRDTPTAWGQLGPERPGAGYWGIEDVNGNLITLIQPNEGDWNRMFQAVYQEGWPAELNDLP